MLKRRIGFSYFFEALVTLKADFCLKYMQLCKIKEELKYGIRVSTNLDILFDSLHIGTMKEIKTRIPVCSFSLEL